MRSMHWNSNTSRWLTGLSSTAMCLLVAACGGGGGGDGGSTGAGSSPASSSMASSSRAASSSAASTSSAASSASSASSASAASSSRAASSQNSSSVAASSARSSSTAAGLVALNADSSCSIAGFREAVLAAVNQARATARQCGSTSKPAVAPLSWEDRLFSAAARHSRDMAENNYFSHDSQDGRNPGQRIAAEGYAGRAWGENIAAGYGTVSAVMEGWLNSPGHCNNIMSSNFTELGVSCVRRSGNTYGDYWTMSLGAR